MASVENYIKYSSKQGTFRAGPVAAGNPKQNLVDMEIPANSGVYDLSQTYVEVVLRPNFTEATAPGQANHVPNSGSGDQAGVFDGHLYYNEDSDAQGAGGNGDYSKVVHPSTGILVKSASMVSSLRGRISNVRNCNVLRANLGVYEHDYNGRNCDHAGLSHSRQELNFVLGNLAELCGDGDDPSQDRPHGVKIMLKDIFNFGMVTDYDSAKYGALQIHLELDLQKIGWRDDSLGTGGGNATALLARHAYGTGVAADVMGLMTQLNAANCAAGKNTLRTSAQYDSMGDHPYYVGQKVTARFVAGGGAGAIADTVVKIKSLTHVRGDADPTEDTKVDIELDRDANLLVPALTGGQTITPTLIHLAPTVDSIAVDRIELVATQVPGEGAGQHSYSEFVLQEDHLATGGAGTTSFDRTYHVPPNCVSCLVTFPSPVYSHDQISSYRVAINNEQLTTRDVVADSPLHRDLIKKAFANIPNMELKDLNEFVVLEDEQSNNAASYKAVKCLMFPLPLSPDQQMMDLSVELLAAASGKINIFFQQLKTV